MKKKISSAMALILSAAVAAASLTGCGTTADKTGGSSVESTEQTAAEGTGSAEAGEALDTFSFIGTEPNTLNMIESVSNLDAYVFYLTSAMLYRSIDLEVVPELCDTMTVSDDKLTYTYTIKDATYSDGTVITAEDFVYYMIHKYLTSENSNMFVGGEDTYNNSLDTCEGIYATDEKTFVVTLTQPNVSFTGELEIYPLQQAFVEAKGDNLGGTPADLQYSGPYILTDWTVGASMTFVKNDSYVNADTLFPTKNLKLVVSSDASTTYSMFSNGEVDAVVNVNADLYEMMDPARCTNYQAGSVWGVEYNTTGFTYSDGDGFASRGDDVTALMQNKNFRMALSYVLDRASITAAVDPASTPTNRYVGANVSGSTDGSSYVEEYELTEVAPLEGDKEAALGYLQAALDELGYADVSELPELTFLTFDSVTQKKTVETIVSLWKSELGLENIKINLQPMQSAIMSMVYMNYDMYLQMLTVNEKDPLEFLSYWETTGGVSDVAGFQTGGAPSFMASMHADEAYDALIEDAYADFDQASYCTKMLQAEQMLYSAYVDFPIMMSGSYYATQDYVDGYVNAYEENGYGFAHLVVNAH